MQNIKTFDDACAVKGVSATLPDMSSWPADLRRPFVALYKLTVIRDAIVGDWTPDWNDGSQKKWYPWFYLNSPGFRLYRIVFFWTATNSGAGSRLCFETEEQAKHCASQFLLIWEEYITLMPPLADEVKYQGSKSFDSLPPFLRRLKKVEQAKVIALEAAMLSPTEDVLDEAKRIYEWLEN